MRSGSSAQDGSGWPSAQRPHSDEATSSPVRYGSGPRSDPHEGLGGRHEVPFGPEISWPYGFRQMDDESRDVLESAYGTGPCRGAVPQAQYQQPAVDDYGYGDPGYADPSYEGPRTPYGGSAFGGQPGVGQPGVGQPGVGPHSVGQHGAPQERPRIPRPRDPRVRTARVRGPRLPAAGRRTAVWRLGDLAGDRRPGGPSRHWPAAGRAGLGHAGRWPAGRLTSRRSAARGHELRRAALRPDPEPVHPASPATTSRLTTSRGTRSCGAAARRTPSVLARSTS